MKDSYKQIIKEMLYDMSTEGKITYKVWAKKFRSRFVDLLLKDYRKGK